MILFGDTFKLASNPARWITFLVAVLLPDLTVSVTLLSEVELFALFVQTFTVELPVPDKAEISNQPGLPLIVHAELHFMVNSYVWLQVSDHIVIIIWVMKIFFV